MQETEVIGVVRKGRGGVASLILRKCQWKSQCHKGEIKVQETQKKGVAGRGDKGSFNTARERSQGAKHKASQIDLSLHQESSARALHYHTQHTLLRWQSSRNLLGSCSTPFA